MITWKTVPEVFAEEEARLGKEIKRCWDDPQGYVYFSNGRRIATIHFFPKIGDYALMWHIRRNISRDRFSWSGRELRIAAYGSRRSFYFKAKMSCFPREFFTGAFHETNTKRISKKTAREVISQARQHLAEFRERIMLG